MGREDFCGGNTAFYSINYIRIIGGQEEINFKGLEIGGQIISSCPTPIGLCRDYTILWHW